MKRAPSRMPSLETFLWVLAAVLAFVAFILFAPGFFSAPAATAKSSTALPTITPRPTLTPLPPLTVLPPFAPAPIVRTPQPVATPAAGAQTFTFIANPTLSGWVRTGESLPHWGDRNLNVGVLKGDQYQAVLYFDLSTLAPGTKILYADVELTGLQRDKLSAAGTWNLRLLKPDLIPNWVNRSPADLSKAATAADIGKQLKPEDLGVGIVNQFIFQPDQLPLLVQAIDGSGIVTFRVDGTTNQRDSLFVWDNGGIDLNAGAHPVLRIVAVPGKFVSVTNTPTPMNIITAAAEAQTQAAHNQRYGTPTPFPRNYATATPYFLITPRPTPANPETPTAAAALATAIAETTGTYTPTPSNWATAFPTPTSLYIPLDTLTPFATPTAIPGPDQLMETPIPANVRGTILFYSDHFGNKMPLQMNAQGALLQALSGPDLYNQAMAREPYSPNRSLVAIQAPDSAGLLQIWIYDPQYGTKTPVSNITRGLTYAPAWSPDGSKIAYVSTQTGMTEIFVYDIATRTARQVTFSTGLVYNQHPSWSPDGKSIVFMSNRDTGHFQIWVMNSDGSDMHDISNSPYNDTDPVWVK